MIVIAAILLYMAVVRKYEPLLLVPLAFGIILGNFPAAGLTDVSMDGRPGGLFHYLFQGVILGIYPPLIFLGLGAMSNFEPLLSDPRGFLLGAGAQTGIFVTFFLAVSAGFDLGEAAAIGMMGAANGPTAVFVAAHAAPELLAPVAVAAYALIALVPVIQAPLIRVLTTRAERAVPVPEIKAADRNKKVLFPLAATLIIALFIPEALPLGGMFMFGNLLREAGVVERLSKTAQNELLHIVAVFLLLSIGVNATAENLLNRTFVLILGLGLVAIVVATTTGVLVARFLSLISGVRLNPLVGAAALSAVPEAARLAQRMGQRANPRNFLLLHASGANLAGMLVSTLAAGYFLSLL
ncbi:MAG: sodium ion-translocating decarboxylase subunit beta [Firmicutes bacterium]|nr:sodium ion-translocating decarboxylase subunit beta [Bacillota bacterium]